MTMDDTTKAERERCRRLGEKLHEAIMRAIAPIAPELGNDRLYVWVESSNPNDLGRYKITMDRGGIFDSLNEAYASMEEQEICERELDAFEDLLQLLPDLIAKRRKQLAEHGGDDWEAHRSPLRMKHVIKVGDATIGTNRGDVNLSGMADVLRADQAERATAACHCGRPAIGKDARNGVWHCAEHWPADAEPF
jgi:hypothetical protein